MTRRPRKQKLIQPGLQLRLVGSFVGLAALALLLQFLFLSWRLTSQTMELEAESGALAQELPAMLLGVLAFSLLVLLPVIFTVGILLTFRIAGPIHRFDLYLGSVARGEQVGPCKLRTGDELQFLCDRINEATETLRQGVREPSDAAEPIAS